MTPANDNTDLARHARAILHHVLGKEARQPGSAANTRLLVGLGYARASDAAALDLSLAIAGTDVVAVARAVLRQGEDLTTAGRALGQYQTVQQARSWAAAKLECALSMLAWHPQRIEQERLLAHWRAYAADQRAIRAARAALPLR